MSENHTPKCPLCGARSTWRGQDNTELWRLQIPDECWYCKTEDYTHWQNWAQGIDVTQFGGGPMNANVEVPGGQPMPYLKGVKIA